MKACVLPITNKVSLVENGAIWANERPTLATIAPANVKGLTLSIDIGVITWKEHLEHWFAILGFLHCEAFIDRMLAMSFGPKGRFYSL